MDAIALIAQTQDDQLVSIWLPLLVALAALGGLVLAALRFRPEGESRLYGDAMKMVAELNGQLEAARAEIRVLRDRLEVSRDERQTLEQQVLKLYTRIERLEAARGGRRADDDPA